MINRKLIVNSNCYHGYSIDEAIDGIAKAGINYIELTATKGWTEHVFPTMSLKELQRIKDKLSGSGITPISMSGHCNLMDENRLPDFVDNIHLAGFFGCETIVSSIGEAHLEDQQHASNDLLVSNIKSLIPSLEIYDMNLVLEVHGDHGTGAIINEIVNLVGSSRVKIAYDTGNAIFYGDVDIVEDMKSCIENISYVHIKDKAGETKEWNFPTLGEGIVDFKQVLTLLDDHKNESPISIEIEFTQAGPKDLDEVNQAIIDSKKYLEGIRGGSYD